MTDYVSWWNKIADNPDVVFVVPRDILDVFNRWDRSILIVKHPQLINFLKTDDFMGCHWHNLLVVHPNLSDKANWSLISDALKFNLISTHPQLITYYMVHL